jgi:hypothetical protein
LICAQDAGAAVVDVQRRRPTRRDYWLCGAVFTAHFARRDRATKALNFMNVSSPFSTRNRAEL